MVSFGGEFGSYFERFGNGFGSGGHDPMTLRAVDKRISSDESGKSPMPT